MTFPLFYWVFYHYNHVICFSLRCGAQPTLPSGLRRSGVMMLTPWIRVSLWELPALDRNLIRPVYACFSQAPASNGWSGWGYTWESTDTHCWKCMPHSLSVQTPAFYPKPRTTGPADPVLTVEATHHPHTDLQPPITDPETRSLYSEPIHWRTHRLPSLPQGPPPSPEAPHPWASRHTPHIKQNLRDFHLHFQKVLLDTSIAYSGETSFWFPRLSITQPLAPPPTHGGLLNLQTRLPDSTDAHRCLHTHRINPEVPVTYSANPIPHPSVPVRFGVSKKRDIKDPTASAHIKTAVLLKKDQ